MIIGAPFVVYETQCNLVIEWWVRLLSGSVERLPFAQGWQDGFGCSPARPLSSILQGTLLINKRI